MPHATATCDLEFSGVLLEHATHRQKPIDGEGHMVPALCFVVELDFDVRPHCQVEQLFPRGHDQQCAAAARRLRAGTRVTFHAPLVGLRLVAGNVSEVHVVKQQEAAAA